MTNKAIITWVGVVSGLLTILLAFGNPFSDRAELSAYFESQEYIEPDDRKDELTMFSNNFLSKITISNTGELPANNVHVDLKDGFNTALIIQKEEETKIEKGKPIYIDKIEPNQDIEMYLWSSSASVVIYKPYDIVTISSKDSGKAFVRGDISGDDIIWYINDYFIFIVGGVFLFFYLLASVLEHHSKASKANAKPSSYEEKINILTHAWSIGALSEKEFQSRSLDLIDRETNHKPEDKNDV